MIFLILFIIPALIAVFMLIFFPRQITIGEFGIHLGVQAAVALIAMAIIYHENVSDREVLNGQVSSKERVRVSCRHSYSCNCYTTCSGSGKNQSCSQHCSTCYEHSYDVDWDVATNIGQSFGINTIDRQGLREPPRWTAVRIGEPVAFTHSYDNYIKGSPETLFRYQGLVKKYEKLLPTYPIKTYDYYRLDRVTLVNGMALPEVNKWNQELSELNGRLGPKKQANVVLVVTKALDREYFYALSEHWLGGKKNDVVVVVNSPDGQTIDWTGVMSWSDHQALKVELRDSLLDHQKLDVGIFPLIEEQVGRNFERKHMRDFKYLKGAVQPTSTQLAWAIAIGTLISIGLAIFFYEEETV